MTPTMPFQPELEVALDAATIAARILTARAGADRVREKGRADLVTEVDDAAEAAVIERIRRDFPEDLIIAEEQHALVRGGGRRWIIDPLDGTVNYVHGHPFVCVSVAFADADGPAAAVVHAPFLDEIYDAARGGGARLNGSPIHVSGVSDGASGLYGTGFPFKQGKGDPGIYFRLVADLVQTSHGVRRAGAAALDLAFVAAGRLDGFFEIGLAPWDIAAGLLLVTEAGGAVAGWPGDSRPPLDTGRVLATNGAVHDWLRSRIASFAPPL
jgi:myo-inositol-1(or 4)-monophosphatase